MTDEEKIKKNKQIKDKMETDNKKMLEDLIELIEEKIRKIDLSDDYLKEHNLATREEVGIGEYSYGISMIPCESVYPFLLDLQIKNKTIKTQQEEIKNAYWKGYTARDAEAQNICKMCKYRTEKGNKYELREAENKQRKFSRKNGTKLRFMTYDNIDKMFRIIENEIDIDSIEELDKEISYTGTEYSYKWTDREKIIVKKQNELVQAVKQLNRELKEYKNK